MEIWFVCIFAIMTQFTNSPGVGSSMYKLLSILEQCVMIAETQGVIRKSHIHMWSQRVLWNTSNGNALNIKRKWNWNEYYNHRLNTGKYLQAETRLINTSVWRELSWEVRMRFCKNFTWYFENTSTAFVSGLSAHSLDHTHILWDYDKMSEITVRTRWSSLLA